jgi:hypothetical protein
MKSDHAGDCEYLPFTGVIANAVSQIQGAVAPGEITDFTGGHRDFSQSTRMARDRRRHSIRTIRRMIPRFQHREGRSSRFSQLAGGKPTPQALRERLQRTATRWFCRTLSARTVKFASRWSFAWPARSSSAIKRRDALHAPRSSPLKTASMGRSSAFCRMLGLQFDLHVRPRTD